MSQVSSFYLLHFPNCSIHFAANKISMTVKCILDVA